MLEFSFSKVSSFLEFYFNFEENKKIILIIPNNEENAEKKVLKVEANVLLLNQKMELAIKGESIELVLESFFEDELGKLKGVLKNGFPKSNNKNWEREIVGLYGEFDFSINNEIKIEVKTSLKSGRNHRFSHHQLYSLIEKILVASCLLIKDRKGKTLHLDKKVHEIGVYAENPGSAFNFSLALERVKFYDAKNIPKYEQPEPPRVTNTHYCSMTKYSHLSKEELLKIIEKQEKELELKKYGLPEQVVLDCENNLPILKRIREKQIKTDNSDDNILIEGDNYHSLTCLNYTHKDKIDLIYIDPPYNTGKKDEWKYNDKFIDENDQYRHAKWLNMMEKRLELAKNLLKEDGVIFISIGEQELANLNLLCGKIFGHENFLTIMARRMKAGSDKGSYFAPSCDFVVCYANNKTRIDTIIPPGNIFPPEKKEGVPVPSATENDKQWRWSYPTLISNKHLLVFKETKTSPLLDQDGNKSKYNIYVKSYLEARKEKGVKPRNFLEDKSFLNSRATKYLKSLGLDFPYSKPKELIIHLIEITHTPKDAIILDFFAGSGTTGEAVLELNKEEKTQRKFILCTNNEGQIAEEVCYPRLEKIIRGYTKKGKVEEKIAGLEGNLQYFQTDLIPVTRLNNISDEKRKELTEKAGWMIAIKEETFEEVECGGYYQIFESKDKQRKTAIYFREDMTKFAELIEKIKANKTTLYIFSYGRVDKNAFQHLEKNITIEDIPEPIIEIYKEVNLTLQEK
ncbi:32565_t:CDS:2 [Gigaspora margarita]|uniref:32565_t:CDS:1 n=1 Tax=Gigaspora margarita TaxID=4874 RepID=A0ABM8VWK6_GIGMA|nr:32565_t:CDS:2 [Gigaspora margarita]